MVDETPRYDDVVAKYPSHTRLAKGGQKVVFLVEHPSYGECVLKIGSFRSEDTLERIRREVAVLNEVASPYYPRQFCFGVLEGSRFMVLEEYIAGDPLAAHLDEFSPVDKATDLLRQIVMALQDLWRRRVVHRDLKPNNIILAANGRPVVLDLGIARVLDAESLTHSLAPRGPCTPAYAAPEQLYNRKHAIDHRTDQFSLGIIYAQLLGKGRHPFDPQVVGVGDSIPENIVSGQWVEPIPEGETGFGALAAIRRLLAPEPYGRYRRPDDVRQVFEGIIQRATNG